MVKVTCLIENTALSPALAAEHGLSLLVETPEKRFLLDCGDTGRFLDNAAALGEDAGRCDAVVISHGHYDHARGYLRYAAEFPGVPLYMSPYAFPPVRLWDDPERGFGLSTGAGFDAAWLMERRIAWRAVTRPVTDLGGGAYLLAGIPRGSAFEPIDPTDLADRGAGLQPDDYRDELAMACDLGGSLLVMSGCSHTGMANICEAAKERLGKPVSAYLGGSHLLPCGEERIAATADWLNASGIRAAVLGHCTGEKAAALLQDRCPAFRKLAGGGRYTF